MLMTKNTIIRNSNKKGKGIFALKNFKTGALILTADFTKAKKIISRKYIKKLSDKDKTHLDYIGNNKYVIDYSVASYVNHSCNPNSYVKYSNMRQKYLVALKTIKKGEEIAFDYSIGAVDDWAMKCFCGSKNCRKIIYGNFLKIPKSLQIKYFKYLPPWNKRKYKNKIKL